MVGYECIGTRDDHEGQQRPGTPLDGPARRGPHARQRRRRAGSRAGFYVAATRATQKLVMGIGNGWSAFGLILA